MLHRALNQYVARPLSRLLLRTVHIQDPWLRFPCDVPLARYGLGARRDFSWYFEGPSAVNVRDLSELEAWLHTCSYRRDPDLFREADFWQHPTTFETLRQGDCEDFALWTWRKLVELGHDAEFVVGRLLDAGDACDHDAQGHAWVLLRDGADVRLIDPVVHGAGAMMQPLELVQDAYVPEASVDGRLQRYAFGGYYLLLLQEQRQAT